MAEPAARDHRHRAAAGRHDRGEQERDLVPHAARGVLVEHRARRRPSRGPCRESRIARGERDALRASRSRKKIAIGQRGDLAVGQRAVRDAGDERGDLLVGRARPPSRLRRISSCGMSVSSHRRPSPPALAERASRSSSRPRGADPERRGVAQPAPSSSSARARYSAACAAVRTPPEALKPPAPSRSRIASSIARAASGVAPGLHLAGRGLDEVGARVERVARPRAMTRGRRGAPVSRITFSAPAAARRRGRPRRRRARRPRRRPARRARAARRRPRRRRPRPRLRALARGRAPGRGRPRGKFATAATRDRRARELARGARPYAP